MEYWKKLIVDLKVSPTERIENGFSLEKVAMSHDGEWKLLSYLEDYPDLEFGYVTLPVAAEGVKPIIPLGGRACVLPTGVKNQDIAWKLIQWVMNDKEQMRYAKAMVGLTAKKTLLNDPWFNDNPEFKHSLNDMQYVKPKAADNILQMNQFLGDAVQEVIINGADIKKSLDAAAKKYNDLQKK
jgi:ABC-type glycerol-3-phosphate transport system substrate-binding protein